jgi:hypothetical protein
MAQKEENGGKKEPVYPYHDLGRSLTVGEAVTEIGGGRAPVSKTLLASHLETAEMASGFAQLLSSAKCFGIIQGRSDYFLTPEAKRYFYPTNDRDQHLARLGFLTNPSAFKLLIERFDGGRMPSAEILRNVLITYANVPQSWAPRAASLFVASAKECGVVDSKGFLRYRASQQSERGRQLGDQERPVGGQQTGETELDDNFNSGNADSATSQPIQGVEGVPTRAGANVWVYSEAGATVRLETPVNLPMALWERLSKYVQVLKPSDQGAQDATP